MRTALLVVPLLLLPLATALPAAPAPAILAHGPVDVVGSEGCDVRATVEIESATRAVDFYPLHGTGLVELRSTCWIFSVWPWVGGQSYEFGTGTCRILEDRNAECWWGYGWSNEAPVWEENEGLFLRLGADGAFVFEGHQIHASGTLVRTP